MGAPGIEIDVRLTKDGEVVLMHDDTIDRTTDGTGSVGELNYNELEKYDAGIYYDESFAGEHVPKLDEVVELIDGRAKLCIEIKDNNDKGIVGKVADIIDKHGSREWCRIASFNDDVLRDINEYDPSISLMKLFVGKIPCLPFYIDYGLNGRSLDEYGFVKTIGMNKDLLTQEQVSIMKKMGFEVLVWTVNDRDKAVECDRWGVDAVISNYPDLLRK